MDAKCGFGRLIDPTRAEPRMIAKRGRPVVVVMAVEEFEWLKALDAPAKREGHLRPTGRTGGGLRAR